MGPSPASPPSQPSTRRRLARATVLAVLLVLVAFYLLLRAAAEHSREPVVALPDLGQRDARLLTGAVTAPRCGDGRLDLGEECDPPGAAWACDELVPGAEGSGVCAPTCVWDLDVCWADDGVCGNGRVEGVELCDDGNAVNGDGCDASCLVEVGGWAVHVDGPAIDARIERALLYSPCRDPAVRAGARRTAPRRVAYRLHVCELSGGEPVFDLGRVRASLGEAARELRPAGLELVEGALEVAPFGSGCRLAWSDARLHAVAANDRTAGLLPLFFARSITGGPTAQRGWAGYASFGYGAVLASTEPSVLAHELGHVFGLLHTHACLGGGRDADCDQSGDGSCDTPYDPGPAWLPHRCGSRAAETCAPDCAGGACSGGAEPDRANFMSYYTGCQDHFASDQLDLMGCVLDHDLVGLTGAGTCESERCNGVDDDCDGAVDEEDICAPACRAAERLGVGSTAGSTRGRGEAYGGREGYPEGTPDVLYELRPAASGAYCVTAGAGAGTGGARLLVAQRDGCEWDARLLAASWDGGGGGLRPLEVRAGPDEPAWISVDGWGRSDGVSYRLDVTAGACGGEAGRLRAPRLVAPWSGARLPADEVALTWEPVAGADAYEVRIGLESAGLRDDSCATCSSQIVDETGVLFPAAPRERSVFWTVRALRGSAVGPFASPRTFIVDRPAGEEPPAAPRLVSPADGARLGTLVERFTWEPVPGAQEYEYRLGLVPSGLTNERCEACLIQRLVGLEYVPSVQVLAPGYDYEWTVRAVAWPAGSGPFATPRAFDVAPGICTLVGRLAVGDEEGAVSQADGVDDFTSRCGGASTAEHVWVVVPERDGRLCFDTLGSAFDTVLSLRERCELSETELGCNDEGFADVEGASQIESAAVLGQPIFAIVDGYGPEDAGAYRLRVSRGSCR